MNALSVQQCQSPDHCSVLQDSPTPSWGGVDSRGAAPLCCKLRDPVRASLVFFACIRSFIYPENEPCRARGERSRARINHVAGNPRDPVRHSLDSPLPGFLLRTRLGHPLKTEERSVL